MTFFAFYGARMAISMASEEGVVLSISRVAPSCEWLKGLGWAVCAWRLETGTEAEKHELRASSNQHDLAHVHI